MDLIISAIDSLFLAIKLKRSSLCFIFLRS